MGFYQDEVRRETIVVSGGGRLGYRGERCGSVFNLLIEEHALY